VNLANELLFSLRLLRRDWRAGELRMVALALIVAVGSISAVGFFTDRVRGAMSRQASELLAADLVVASRQTVPATLTAAAQKRGLATTTTTTFPSVVIAPKQTRLAEVKAVADGYPLRGTVRIADRPFGPDRATTLQPAPGTAWLDARLMSELQLAIGDTVQLGHRNLRVDAVIAYEPDRGGDMFSIAPRLMFNAADLDATRLIQIGSRISYRLLIAGDDAAVSAYRNWVAARLQPGMELQGVRDARPEMRAALDRAEQFLGLAALVSVILAGVAIAISARRYASRHLDATAMLRCLGASQATVVRLYGGQLVVLALAASGLGVLLGMLAQLTLAQLLAELVGDALPPPGIAPAVAGIITGLVMLIGFGLPPVLQLRHVPPVRVLRKDIGTPGRYAGGVYGAALVAVAALMLWQTRDATLAVYVLLGSAATLAVLATTAWMLVKLSGRLLRGRVGVAWRFGIANIARRSRASSVQLLAFGLGITVMLLLAIVRTDLVDQWQASLPRNAPNFFVINVQSSQLASLKQFLREEDMETATLYPMVRARLTAVNDKPVDPSAYVDPRARRLAEREQNLSWAAVPQKDNRIVAGRWWQAGERGKPALSLEQGLAERLGLKLGDRLEFSIAGEPVVFTVTSLRTVEWDSFDVNFFMVAQPGILDDFPASYITSFHLDRDSTDLLARLVRQFPNLTVIDVSAIMGKVRTIMERVTLAVEYVFLFTLLAGVVVLWAAIQATQDERRHEGAILRALGASRRQLVTGMAAEFATLGALAGILAVLAATATGFVLATEVFHLPYRFNPHIGWIGIAAGVLGIGITGTLGARTVLRHPPLHTLRRI
jgi:putative ABC transport system permease protein